MTDRQLRVALLDVGEETSGTDGDRLDFREIVQIKETTVVNFWEKKKGFIRVLIPIVFSVWTLETSISKNSEVHQPPTPTPITQNERHDYKTPFTESKVLNDHIVVSYELEKKGRTRYFGEGSHL